jgi:hypothetical protein
MIIDNLFRSKEAIVTKQVFDELKMSVPGDMFRNVQNYGEFKRSHEEFARGRRGVVRVNEDFERLDPLLRKPGPDEEIAWGIFDSELRLGYDVVRVCYFNASSGRPVESFDDDLNGVVTRRQSYFHYESTTNYPSLSCGNISIPVTKQYEYEYENGELTAVNVRRLIYSDWRSDCGLVNYFFLAGSSFCKADSSALTSHDIWMESERTYSRPTEDGLTEQISYTPDPSGILICRDLYYDVPPVGKAEMLVNPIRNIISN